MYVLKQCLQFCDCLILNTNMSMLDTIDKKSHEIKQEDEIIDSIEELVEELPDTSPRYVILSYPFKLDDGRLKTPLVMLYWIPPTSGQEVECSMLVQLSNLEIKLESQSTYYR